MRKFIVAMFALAVISSPAAAQNLTADVSLGKDSRIVKTVNVEDLKAIVVASGYKVTGVGGNGKVSVQAKTEDGLIFLLIGAACGTDGKSPDCQGINMQVRYDADDNVTLEAINTSNLSFAATSTWYDEGGNTVGISRYVILDHGVSMGSIRINLETLLSISSQVTEIIWPS